MTPQIAQTNGALRHGQGAFDGARVSVVGLGASGRAAVDVLVTLGARVVAVDGAESSVDKAREELGTYRGARGSVDYRFAADPQELANVALGLADGADVPGFTVVSPGIPSTSPLHVTARETGRPLWSEIELAWHMQVPGLERQYAPWLAITGTNGKTTTVSMLSAILEQAGLVAPAVGNVGTPAVLIAARGGVDALPAELSSFQLHTTHSLAPLASVVLNVAPDHIDWHGSYDGYRDDKARIYERTTGFCLFTPDPQTRTMVENADVAEGARAVGVTLGSPGLSEVGLVEDVLCERAFEVNRCTHAVELASLQDLAHLAPGGAELPPHLVLDALVAAGMARAAGVEPAAVRDALRGFSAGQHRIAIVAQKAGITWVDDSKATNAHAADASLAAIAPGRAVWVAGGIAKGARFEELVSARRDRLRAAILIGAERGPLREALAERAPGIPVVEVDTGSDGHAAMKAAVAHAQRFAQPGDIVVLAPACSSFDQFASYGARGDVFADAVRAALGGADNAGGE